MRTLVPLDLGWRLLQDEFLVAAGRAPSGKGLGMRLSAERRGISGGYGYDARDEWLHGA
jgi:hypothetical protein